MSGVVTASKVKPAALDFGDHVFAADEIAGLFGFAKLVALRDHRTDFDLPEAVRQSERAPHKMVSFAGINSSQIVNSTVSSNFAKAISLRVLTASSRFVHIAQRQFFRRSASFFRAFHF